MTPELIHALALITAAQARIAGMQAFNAERLANQCAPGYDESAFLNESHALEQLATHVINLPRGIA